MKKALLAIAVALALSFPAGAEEQKKVDPKPVQTACVCTCSLPAQSPRGVMERFLRDLRAGKLTEPGLVSENAGK